MASIRKEILIGAKPDDVWAALRDWGAVHERLVPGFVVDARVEGEDRVVTFFNGLVVRELFVDLDEEAKRLVWSARSPQLTHHNGAAQVFAEDDGTTRFVWVADVLPHAAAATVGELMQRGIETVKRTMEA